LKLNSIGDIKDYALFVYKATSKEYFNTSWFMPVTREMSDIRRKILQDYLSSYLPIETPNPLVKPMPPISDKSPFTILNREQLVYSLYQAADLEISLMLQYLFAAYSLQDLPEEHVPEEISLKIQEWKTTILQIARQEMLHYGLVLNMLNAIGGTAYSTNHNFPRESKFWKRGGQSVEFSLKPFSKETIERFITFEQPDWKTLNQKNLGVITDGIFILNMLNANGLSVYEMSPEDFIFSSIGSLYSSVRETFKSRNIPQLFIGEEDQIHGIYPSSMNEALFDIHSPEDAMRAIDLIVEQGEGQQENPDPNCHYEKFKKNSK